MKSKPRVLITSPPFIEAASDYLHEFVEREIDYVVTRPKQFFREDEMAEMIKGYDGILCGDDEITEAVLCEADKLRVISKWGVGIDSIDKEAAKRRGIPVCNSPGAFSDACADVAMGYVIMLARGLLDTHTRTRRGKWEKHRGMLLRGRNIGIIGIGHIGKAIAKRAAAFGLNVIGNDIREVEPGIISETNMRVLSRDELLREADLVVVACDLNDSSHHLIDSAALSMMGPQAYVINVARGPIVDTRALVKALRDERIAGSALDVFEQEPLPPDSPLRLFDNCILGSHNAYNADRAVEFVHRNTLDNLFRYLRDEDSEAIGDAVSQALDEASNEMVCTSNVI